MKALCCFIGAVALVAACDRHAGPADTSARAVTGVVEVRLGDVTQRYDLRVDRTGSGFLPALHPIAGGATGGGALGPMATGLEFIPFVRESDGAGPDGVATPSGAIAIPTGAGVVTAHLTYRTLGAWQVLDHAVLSVGGIAASARNGGNATDTDLRVALLDPRLER